MSLKAPFLDQAVVLIEKREAGLPDPKWDPRKKILGLTVLERLILSAHQAGVRDFLLVGPDGDPPEGALPSPEKDRRFRKDDLKIERVSLSGLPEIVRQGKLKSRLWVFDGDVAFDPAILTDAGPDDSSPHRVVGPGIQICLREMLPGLVESLLKHGAATPGPRRQAESGEAPPPGASEAKRRFCLKVVSREDAKIAMRYVLSTGRRPQDGFMARYFLRPVSLWITKYLLKLNITPNMMTAVSLACGGLSVWLIGRGDSRSAALSGCAFQFASILDHCDGANARMTFRISKVGSAVDVVGDALVYILFFLCLPLGLYRADGRRIWLILGLAVFLSMIAFYIDVFRMARSAGGGSISVASGSLFSFHKEIEGQRAQRHLPGIVEKVASRIAFIFRREFFPTAVLLILIFAGTKVLMVLVSILYPVQGVYITLIANRRVREPALKSG
jgi:phosphatidylglycerophosphate synthase